MKRLFTILALLQVLILGAFAQTPDENNEGTKLEYDSENSIWRFKWWGRTGNTYFIQHSDDLKTWSWVPIVEPGDDSIKEWGFTTTSDKFFWRLKYWTGATTDPEGDDFDEDGISNLDEVQQGMSPFKTDSDEDGMSDAYEIANGLNPIVDDTLLDFDGDLIPNREDTRPNDINFGRLTINISTPTDGATIP